MFKFLLPKNAKDSCGNSIYFCCMLLCITQQLARVTVLNAQISCLEAVQCSFYVCHRIFSALTDLFYCAVDTNVLELLSIKTT